MSVFKYFKNIPRSPSHRATGYKCNFFFQICNEVPGGKKRGACRPTTGDRGEKKGGACRPPNGRQAPVARGVGDRPLSPVGGATGPPFFFSRDFVANLKKKKLHFGPVALWEGDRCIFLKYFKTEIYF